MSNFCNWHYLVAKFQTGYIYIKLWFRPPEEIINVEPASQSMFTPKEKKERASRIHSGCRWKEKVAERWMVGCIHGSHLEAFRVRSLQFPPLRFPHHCI